MVDTQQFNPKEKRCSFASFFCVKILGHFASVTDFIVASQSFLRPLRCDKKMCFCGSRFSLSQIEQKHSSASLLLQIIVAPGLILKTSSSSVQCVMSLSAGKFFFLIAYFLLLSKNYLTHYISNSLHSAILLVLK